MHLLGGLDQQVFVARLGDADVELDRLAAVNHRQAVALGDRRGLRLGEPTEYLPTRLYVGLSFVSSSPNGKAAETYLASIALVGRLTVWTDFGLKDAVGGGPLLDRDGRVVGVHTATNSLGHHVYSKTLGLGEQWERRKRGEVRGEWLAGTWPMIGIFMTQTAEGCRIDHVYADTPATAAGMRAKDILLTVDGQAVANYLDVGRMLLRKDPGDGATVVFRRGGRTFKRTIKLMRRHKLPPIPAKAPRN